ncbi:MAG: 23S rRNA (uracil(1939)-C(5))-methyltransferase RlmD [Alkalispirochaetaceae bacterium]
MGRKKKQFPDLRVRSMHHSGLGYAVAEDRPVLVEEGLPGDLVDAVERRKKKGMLHLRVEALKEASIPRVTPFCRHFDQCGGCTMQHLSYETQLRLKEQMVHSALREHLSLPEERHDDPRMEPILGCEKERFYRNKLEFSFSNSRWLTEEEKNGELPVKERRALGFHVPGRFDRVLDIEECHLQPDPSNMIRNRLEEFTLRRGYTYYDPREHHGLLRLLLIRTSLEGETQVTLMFGEEDPKARGEILGFLQQEFPEINSLYYVLNRSRNDALYPQEPIHVSGAPFILEQCGSLRFRIYPKSFYQTNPLQAVRLYEVAREYASLTGKETVYDLFSGIGSIALFLAAEAAKVVAIESVEDAVAAARENAALNGVENAEFHHGDVEALLDERFLAEHGRPDCVILDPPRPGVHERALKVLLQALPERIVYVSCNAETQGRDVAFLSDSYEIDRMRAVDMFPQTRHVEHVMLLKRRDSADA